MGRLRFPQTREVPWSVAQSLGVVIASHATLIMGGSLVLAIAGYGAATSTAAIPIGVQTAATAPFWIAAIGLTVLLVKRTGASFVEDLGASFRWIDIPLGIVIGVVTQLLILPVLYWPILQAIDKSTDDLGKAAQDLADTATGTTTGAVIFLLMAVVFAPIAEEVMYRGALLRGMQVLGWPMAIVVSSTVFAALHLQSLQFIGLFVIGAVCALCAAWSGRLSLAIVVHVAFNAATAIPLVLNS